MREALNISSPTVVIEGIATDIFEYIDNIPQEKGTKTVLYSGGLTKKYGVIELLNAFERLQDENCRLVICGSGDAENDIIEASNRDRRIIFKGLLPRKEVLSLQKSSTILVNQRSNNEEYTKYSFPSKIIEYLSSGTPVVSYILDGMPEEYCKYIYPVSDDNNGLFITLKEVLCKDEEELCNKGQRAKEFVLTYKNAAKQGEKILQMVSRL